MSQIMSWRGEGEGTVTEPYILIPDPQFQEDHPFSIRIEYAGNIENWEYVYFKVPAVSPNVVYRLAVFRTDVNPFYTIGTKDVGRYTAFNGNNNYGLVDGPYVLVQYYEGYYLLKQQAFTSDQVLTEDQIKVLIDSTIPNIAAADGFLEDDRNLIRPHMDEDGIIRIYVSENEIKKIINDEVREEIESKAITASVYSVEDLPIPGDSRIIWTVESEGLAYIWSEVEEKYQPMSGTERVIVSEHEPNGIRYNSWLKVTGVETHELRRVAGGLELEDCVHEVMDEGEPFELNEARDDKDNYIGGNYDE